MLDNADARLAHYRRVIANALNDDLPTDAFAAPCGWFADSGPEEPCR